MLLSVQFLTAALFAVANGANIMVFTPLTSRSESLMFNPYAEALGKQGHKVTIVIAYPPKNAHPNVRSVSPPEMQAVLSQMTDEHGSDMMMHRIKKGYYDEYELTQGLDEFAIGVMKALMIDSQEFIDLVKNGKFDLVVVNGFFNIGGIALSSVFKCPFVYMDGPGLYPHQWESSGNLDYSGAAPTVCSGFASPMSLYERIYNAYMIYHWRAIYVDTINQFDELLRPVYEPLGMKEPLVETEKKVSLVLGYRDASLEYPKATYPNYVRFGCVHCKKGSPVPKDLESFIAGAGEHGFIAFSLGSVCRLQKNKEYFRKNFFEAFAKLPQRIIVKWDANVTNADVGAPPNVKIMDWLPLQDLIAHPKCRAFISHSGLFSTMESIYHGVPVVSVPIFADQDYNANLMQRFGMGIKLEPAEITAPVLLNALSRITTNPSYRENAARRSKILRDQPMAPIDSMVYWSEYVIRHKGADHLRPIDVINMPLYKLWMVDAIVLFASCIAVVLYVLKKLLQIIFSKKDETPKNLKKKNQ